MSPISAAQFGLIAYLAYLVLISPYLDIVHSDHVVVLAQRTTTYSPEFLHVTADAQQETEMHAERTNVCASLT